MTPVEYELASKLAVDASGLPLLECCPETLKVFVERFDRDARTVAALNHPNICALRDVGPNHLGFRVIQVSA